MDARVLNAAAGSVVHRSIEVVEIVEGEIGATLRLRAVVIADFEVTSRRHKQGLSIGLVSWPGKQRANRRLIPEELRNRVPGNGLYLLLLLLIRIGRGRISVVLQVWWKAR